MTTTRTGVRRGLAATVGAALLATLGLVSAESAAAAEPATVVATTQSPGYTEVGTWTTARDPSYDGIQPRYSRVEGDTASWQLEAPADSRYQLGTYYTASEDNGKQVSYSWTTTGGDSGGPVVIDQTRNGGTWNALGNVELDAGEIVTLTVTASPGNAVTKPDLKAITRADAVRIAPLGAACGTVTATPAAVNAGPAEHGAYTLTQSGTNVRIDAGAWAMTIDRVGFRYGFERDGASVAEAHATTGLLLGTDTAELCAAVSADLVSADADGVEFSVLFSNGRTATVEVAASDTTADVDVVPNDAKTSVIRAQLAGGMNPAYGLGDLGGWRSNLNAYGVKNLDYYAQTSGGTTEQRFVSNFAVFPDRGFAEVAFDRGRLAVQIDGDATLLGVTGDKMDGLHYFFGDLETIYGAYKEARNAAGYLDARPDYTFFGVGYESYGALGYNTNQATITQSVTDYLAKGFPISWAVTGSGFWPYLGSAQGTTSSFGMWGEKYPDPDAYKKFFADNDIALILGLRQSFPALPEDGGTYDPEKDGPFVQEALDAGYFIADEDGDPLTFSTISFPSGRVYLIDPDNADAVAWFVEHERLWEADGFKEDHMFNATANNAFAMNDLVNNIDAALADDGALTMVRNSAYSVPGSILRINDTDYNQGTGDRDRTVINSLAYAASGQANYYPDIVGGRIMADLSTNTDKQKYLARNAMYAAMSPSMSFGNEPWVMSDTSLVNATIAAAQWHAEYQPYIYAAAIASYETGYPYTATPLPIAYPHDAATYELVSKTAKQYEWMLGTSLLVAPLYGADATTATARDVYLPAGEWMDIETGETFTGPTTLAAYPQPFGKIPAFVGGDGVLVHEVDDVLEAQVFPMAADGTVYTTVGEDGTTTGSIRIDTAALADVDGRDLVVRDGSGAEVASTVDAVTGALEFPIAYGESYVVADADDPGTDPGAEEPDTEIDPIDPSELDPALDLGTLRLVDGKLVAELGADAASAWFFGVAHSDPVNLGWFRADAAGTVRIPVPSSLPAGAHTLSLYAADGTLAAWGSFTLAAASDSDLASTGAEGVFLMAGIAALALALGCASLVHSRRRAERRLRE